MPHHYIYQTHNLIASRSNEKVYFSLEHFPSTVQVWVLKACFFLLLGAFVRLLVGRANPYAFPWCRMNQTLVRCKVSNAHLCLTWSKDAQSTHHMHTHRITLLCQRYLLPVYLSTIFSGKHWHFIQKTKSAWMKPMNIVAIISVLGLWQWMCL